MRKSKTENEFPVCSSSRRRLEEVVVEVPEVAPRPWPRNADLSVVGKPLPRREGLDKVTGRAKYSYDVNLPHMLWMKILRSPHPHARIRRLDTRQAEAMSGVQLLMTHRNVPYLPWHNGQSKLFDTTMRYVGDEVAAVVAETEAVARDALALIEVEYEELPAVLEPEEALHSDSPPIYEGGNLAGGEPDVLSRGDIERGLAEADYTVEASFRSQTLMHACLETHCAVAQWKGRKLTVWESTQAVHRVRELLAKTLNLLVKDVRVICFHMGSGFGSKGYPEKHTILAALAARQTGRPVKVAPERAEEAHCMGNRPSNILRTKAGCKKDGTLTALYLKGVGTIGGYKYHWWDTTLGFVMHELYRCPNVETEEYQVFINADPGRPHRAPGFIQGHWAMEQTIDLLAAKCGLDPLEFRLRNYAESSPSRDGMPYTLKGLRECYEHLAEVFGWPERETRKRAGSRGHKKRGLGMASGFWGGGGGPPGYAIVKLFPDGTASVVSGAQDIGTGSRTILWQIAAQELGYPPEKVSITIGDTESCPYGSISGGSRTIGSMSPAVRMAAADAKRQLLRLAGEVLSLPADRLSVREGFVFDTRNPSTRKPVTEVTALMNDVDIYRLARRADHRIIGTGFRGPNPEGFVIRTWCAHFAEVEVDIDIGKVRVLRYVAAHESGRIVNPLTFSNQIEGGVVQGIGYALCEERVVHSVSGRILNANLQGYKLPTSLDIPEIEVVPIDVADVAANSCGVKGLGEPAFVPTVAAIANAVHDAIGVCITKLPMTPQRILEALGEARCHESNG